MTLTDGQRDVARLATEGLRVKQIAFTLGISERTVNRRITDIYAIAGVSDRASLVIWLLRTGEIQIDAKGLSNDFDHPGPVFERQLQHHAGIPAHHQARQARAATPIRRQ
jgi:DNA-binding CsgD family transcriptional regulator